MANGFELCCFISIFWLTGAAAVNPTVKTSMLGLPYGYQATPTYISAQSFDELNATITTTASLFSTLDVNETPTGWGLTPSTELFGILRNYNTVPTSITDWRVEIDILADYTTTCGWFSFVFSNVYAHYGYDTYPTNIPYIKNLNGVGVYHKICQGSQFFAELEPVEITKILIPVNASYMSSPTFCPAIFTASGLASYTFIAQFFGGWLTAVLATSNGDICTLANVNATRLVSVFASGPNYIQTSAFFADSVSQANQYFYQLQPSATTTSPATTTTALTTTTTTAAATTTTLSTTQAATTTISTSKAATTTDAPSTTTTRNPTTTTTAPSTTTTREPTTTLALTSSPAATTIRTTTMSPTTTAAISNQSEPSLIYEFDNRTLFPMPLLVDGNMYPSIDIEDLKPCPYIKPGIHSPQANTKIYATFKIEHLIEIDDISETLSILASILLQWRVSYCSMAYTAPQGSLTERLFAPDVHSIWTPQLAFANSTDDTYMASRDYGSKMQVLYVPSKPNRTLFFYWSRLGIMNSICRINLLKFPFDAQTCEFTFLIDEPIEFVNFGGVFVDISGMGVNDQWDFDRYDNRSGYTYSMTRLYRTASYATIILSFSRNPTRYLTNLLAPGLVLICLVFGSFLMDPKHPDRAVLCATILLALVVSQSQVLNEIPHTSQRILFTDYFLSLTGLTAFVTLYHLAVCSLTGKALALKQVSIFKSSSTRLSAVRAVDCSLALVALGFFLLINLRAATVVL